MKDFDIYRFLDMCKYRNSDLFKKVVGWMKTGVHVCLAVYAWLHVNRNISGTFIFISHLNSLVGILSFAEYGQKTEYFADVIVETKSVR